MWITTLLISRNKSPGVLKHNFAAGEYNLLRTNSRYRQAKKKNKYEGNTLAPGIASARFGSPRISRCEEKKKGKEKHLNVRERKKDTKLFGYGQVV